MHSSLWSLLYGWADFLSIDLQASFMKRFAKCITFCWWQFGSRKWRRNDVHGHRSITTSFCLIVNGEIGYHQLCVDDKIPACVCVCPGERGIERSDCRKFGLPRLLTEGGRSKDYVFFLSILEKNGDRIKKTETGQRSCFFYFKKLKKNLENETGMKCQTVSRKKSDLPEVQKIYLSSLLLRCMI